MESLLGVTWSYGIVPTMSKVTQPTAGKMGANLWRNYTNDVHSSFEMCTTRIIMYVMA